MPSDQELRDRMLRNLYEQRHAEHKLISLPAGLKMPDVEEHVLANILGQLRDMGLVKWHRTMGGHCRGAAEITSYGIREIEEQDAVVATIPPVDLLPDSRPTAHPIHTLIVWFTFVLGIVLVAAGIALVWLGSKGTTTFKLFGNDFTSDNVGVASLFIGVVLVVLNFRRVLKSVERIK
jgi:hypothetical protein